MSLLNTLVKVAVGVAIAKGVSAITKTASSKGTGRTAGGGLADMMKDAIGGGTRGTTRSSQNRGGLDDLLGNLTKPKTTTTRRASAPQGGFEDLLGSLTGQKSGTGKSTGGLGDILGGVLGGAAGGAAGGAMGGRLGDAFGGGAAQPAPQEELAAALMLRAMIQAAKSDGDLSAEEEARLMDHLGDATEEEVAFVRSELNAPVDINGLVGQTPSGMEPQLYMASLMAIDLDQQAEAEYLHSLAKALELSVEEVNDIHDRAGAPRIYG